MVLTVGFIDGFDHYPVSGAAGTQLGILQAWNAMGAGTPVGASFDVGYRGRGKRLELSKSLVTPDGRLYRAAPVADPQISCHWASSITHYDAVSARGWVSLRDTLNAEIFLFQTLPAGAIGLYNGASLLASTAPITAQVPHRFNLVADMTDTNNVHVELWVDGDRDTKGINFTGDAANSTNPFRILGLEQWGYGAGTDNGNDHGFDDVVYCYGAAQNIGELEVITDGPTADFQEQWTPLSGTDNFEMVNELPPNGDTDYNSSTVVGNIDLQEFPVLPTTPDSIFCVSQIFGIRKEEAGTRGFAGVCHTDIDYVQTTQNVATSYDWFYQHYLENPETIDAWLVAERAAAKFGYKDAA